MPPSGVVGLLDSALPVSLVDCPLWLPACGAEEVVWLPVSDAGFEEVWDALCPEVLEVLCPA